MEEMRETVSSEPLSSKEKVEYLEKFIVKGGKFITKKQYQKAIDYFGSREMANKVGIDFSNDAVSMTWSSTLQSEDIQRIADSLAPVCRLDLDPPYFNRISPNSRSRGTIILATLNTPKEIAVDKNYKKLLHEVALIYIEEWLHGLQHLKLKPITGYFEPEHDVAVYMLDHKIPMTKSFLRRYGRGRFINELKQERFVSRIKNFTHVGHLIQKIFKKEEK